MPLTTAPPSTAPSSPGGRRISAVSDRRAEAPIESLEESNKHSSSCRLVSHRTSPGVMNAMTLLPMREVGWPPSAGADPPIHARFPMADERVGLNGYGPLRVGSLANASDTSEE